MIDSKLTRLDEIADDIEQISDLIGQTIAKDFNEPDGHNIASLDQNLEKLQSLRDQYVTLIQELRQTYSEDIINDIRQERQALESLVEDALDIGADEIDKRITEAENALDETNIFIGETADIILENATDVATLIDGIQETRQTLTDLKDREQSLKSRQTQAEKNIATTEPKVEKLNALMTLRQECATLASNIETLTRFIEDSMSDATD